MMAPRRAVTAHSEPFNWRNLGPGALFTPDTHCISFLSFIRISFGQNISFQLTFYGHLVAGNLFTFFLKEFDWPENQEKIVKNWKKSGKIGKKSGKNQEKFGKIQEKFGKIQENVQIIVTHFLIFSDFSYNF